jgi:hypothetical protein
VEESTTAFPSPRRRTNAGMGWVAVAFCALLALTPEDPAADNVGARPFFIVLLVGALVFVVMAHTWRITVTDESIQWQVLRRSYRRVDRSDVVEVRLIEGTIGWLAFPTAEVLVVTPTKPIRLTPLTHAVFTDRAEQRAISRGSKVAEALGVPFQVDDDFFAVKPDSD